MKIRNILKNKDSFSLVITFVFVIGFIAYFIYVSYHELLTASKDKELYKLLGITNTVATEFDGDEVFALNEIYPNKDDISNSNDEAIYSKYHTSLQEAYKRNKLTSPIYTYTLDPSTGDFFYNFTSDNQPSYRHKYEQPPKKMIAIYEEGGVIEPYENDFGYWISAFSPIYNSVGEVVAVVQADSRYDEILKQASAAAWKQTAFSSIIMVLLAIGLIKFVKSNLKRDELEKTYIKLKSTQDQLIQSEKMASLGALISGITHEINTPLGVMNGAISNIMGKMEDIKRDYPKFVQSAPKEMNQSFDKLVSLANVNIDGRSTREERKLKKEVKGTLEKNGIEGFDNYLADFVKLGLHDKISPLKEDLSQPNSVEMFKNALDFGMVELNALNMDIAIKKMHKIIFALKNYSHHDNKEEKVKTNILKGIETVLVLYYNQLKHGIEVITNFKDTDEYVLGIPDELDQVWTNLINNGIYAMEGNGKMIINHYKKDSVICVEIIDSGKGIKRDDIEKIFNPFFTTKAKGEGTGLGLDICKKIIEKHNGTISVASEPGETKFTVELPLFS